MPDDKLKADYGFERETDAEYQERLAAQRASHGITEQDSQPVADKTVEVETEKPTPENTDNIIFANLGISVFELLTPANVDRYAEELKTLIASEGSLDNLARKSNIYRSLNTVLTAYEILLSPETKEKFQEVVDMYIAAREKSLLAAHKEAVARTKNEVESLR